MKRHSIIKHPGARTRALYRWELEEIFIDRRNGRFDLIEGRRFIKDFWRFEGRVAERAPALEFGDGDSSYCEGRAKIFLHFAEIGPVILVHELIHAKGFGQGKNVHSVSFVLDYVRCLARFCGYFLIDLRASAMMRRLI